MAIFIEIEKKQKKLIYLAIIFLIISVFLLWFSFSKKPVQIEKEIIIKETSPRKFISELEKLKEIDFEIFNNQFLKELKLFEKIKSYEGEAGRENPFIPY